MTTIIESTATPLIVYRVSIHNQIYTTVYYVVTEWTKSKNGGWSQTGERIGMRGKGNSLGMSCGEASIIAGFRNKEAGWRNGMEILNSKGKRAFDLHI